MPGFGLLYGPHGNDLRDVMLPSPRQTARMMRRTLLFRGRVGNSSPLYLASLATLQGRQASPRVFKPLAEGLPLMSLNP